MQALVKRRAGPGNIELCDWPQRSPGPGEVKIRVEAAGVCGSDLHIWHNDIQIPMRPPFVVGHEFAGTIAELGPGVEKASFSVGARVTAETTFSSCGACLHCRTGNYNLCTERRGIGYWYDGAFAEYCVVPAERVHPLPEVVSMRAAAMCEPLACCVHAVLELTHIEPDDLVILAGPGPIGLLCLQLAKLSGARVFVCGTRADMDRLQLARNLGADAVYNVEAVDLVSLVMTETGGLGADVFLECSGAAPAARLGLDILRKGGYYTQVGLFGRSIEIDFARIAYKELHVTGSFSQKWTAWRRGLRLLAEGRVRTEPLISHEFPLALWEEAFRTHEEKKGLKVILRPGKSVH